MMAFVPHESRRESRKGDGGSEPYQTGPKESLDDVEMEDGKRDIIHREIDKFREIMKIREAEKEEERKRDEERRKRDQDSTQDGGKKKEAKKRSQSRTRSPSEPRGDSKSKAASPRSRSREVTLSPARERESR
jgi:RNA-binding protein 25